MQGEGNGMANGQKSNALSPGSASEQENAQDTSTQRKLAPGRRLPLNLLLGVNAATGLNGSSTTFSTPLGSSTAKPSPSTPIDLAHSCITNYQK